jgi:prepilin-type N-terminal cleavage/methylation domain-containing protein
MRKSKGFTWVELLIVVAILGMLAAVVIPNVVGLMHKVKFTDNGAYYNYEKDGCQIGNWTIDGKIYKSFCPNPLPAYTYRYFCESCSGNFYPCRDIECTSPPEYIYLGNNEIAAYCSSCSGNVTPTPCEEP